MSPLAPYVWAFAAYVGLGVLFQWMIQRRAFRTITRALIMGAVDTLFLTFFVQRLGTLSSALPIVYVAAPVLYATTTPRKRVALFTAWFGLTSYAATVLLEQLDVIDYAPGMPELARPDAITALSTFSARRAVHGHDRDADESTDLRARQRQRASARLEPARRAHRLVQPALRDAATRGRAGARQAQGAARPRSR